MLALETGLRLLSSRVERNSSNGQRKIVSKRLTNAPQCTLFLCWQKRAKDHKNSMESGTKPLTPLLNWNQHKQLRPMHNKAQGTNKAWPKTRIFNFICARYGPMERIFHKSRNLRELLVDWPLAKRMTAKQLGYRIPTQQLLFRHVGPHSKIRRFSLKNHIQKNANHGSGHTNYLSLMICTEFIELMGKCVLSEITSHIKESR